MGSCSFRGMFLCGFLHDLTIEVLLNIEDWTTSARAEIDIGVLGSILRTVEDFGDSTSHELRRALALKEGNFEGPEKCEVILDSFSESLREPAI